MRDLKKHRHLAGTLFNILFNLNKFIAFETRDPFLVRQARLCASGWFELPTVSSINAAMPLNHLQTACHYAAIWLGIAVARSSLSRCLNDTLSVR